MKIYITAMARNKKHLEFILNQQSEQIVRHIAKIVILDNDSNNHWMTEIASFIDRIPKLKNTKKYPNAKFIFNNTYGTIYDILGNLAIVAVDPSGIEPTKEEIDIIDKVSKDYFRWLANELSIKGIIRINDVRSKLTELISKYRG